jgi:hypothetical protein
MQCSIYGPFPLLDNPGFERRILYKIVNVTVLHDVCERERERGERERERGERGRGRERERKSKFVER